MSLFNLTLLIESFLITFAIILILKPVAIKAGLVDHPCTRKNHIGQIPLIGGVSIFLCLAILYYKLPFDNYAYILAASLIVICGIIDDYKPLHSKLRLIVEAIAAWIIIKWGGVEIYSLGNLLGFGEINLGAFSTPFTIFAIIGGINAFNMIDGIDGLAGSLSLLVFLLLFIIGYDDQKISSLCLFFIAAITAFLIFNMRIFGRKKASVFLGDTGSMLFGFTICWIVISVSQDSNKLIQPVNILWIIALPLLDTVSIMLRRIKKHQSPFAPDREHFHHILPLAGYTINQTVSLILILALSLGSFGILAPLYFNLPEWLMFGLFLMVFYGHYWGISHAWKVMKIARYLREHKNDRRNPIKDRREKETSLDNKDKERRTNSNRRADKDRRYQQIEKELIKRNLHSKPEFKTSTKKTPSTPIKIK